MGKLLNNDLFFDIFNTFFNFVPYGEIVKHIIANEDIKALMTDFVPYGEIVKLNIPDSITSIGVGFVPYGEIVKREVGLTFRISPIGFVPYGEIVKQEACDKNNICYFIVSSPMGKLLNLDADK